MAAHYGVAIIPTRPGKPRDKAKVEAGVLLAERWILARLRNRALLLAGRGERRRSPSAWRRSTSGRSASCPGTRRRGSRSSTARRCGRCRRHRYEFARWRIGLKVNIDYHVEFDRHYYSVPHQLVGARVDVRATATTVEVFHASRRVASHLPRRHAGTAHHRPRPHARVAPPPRRVEPVAHRGLGGADRAGHRRASPRRSCESRPHPEQGYRCCLGIIRLADRYGAERVEAACARALAVRALSYRSVESILRHGLDRQPLRAARRPAPIPTTRTCAAPATTSERNRHAAPTPPSTGCTPSACPAWSAASLEQREHPDYAALGFEERLGLLVDRELTERAQPQPRTSPEGGQAALPGHRRRHRLPPPRGLDRAQILVPRRGPLGRRPPQRGHRRRHRARQDLPRLRPRQRRHPPRPHRPLPARPRLLDELAIARADGRLARLLATWARIDVLVVDDFLIRPLAPDQAADLLEVIEDRVQLRSTIVTSQLPVAMWHEALGEPTVADGILDRLLENVHRIELHGESMRRGDAGRHNHTDVSAATGPDNQSSQR